MLVNLLRRLGLLQSWYGPCAIVGAAAGSIAGVIFGLVQDEHPGETLSTQELLLIVGLSAGVAYVLCLLVVGVWYRYGVLSIALPALFTSLLAALVAVWVANRIGTPEIAPIVGLFVGLLIGTLLCDLCRALPIVRVLDAERKYE